MMSLLLSYYLDVPSSARNPRKTVGAFYCQTGYYETR